MAIERIARQIERRRAAFQHTARRAFFAVGAREGGRGDLDVAILKVDVRRRAGQMDGRDALLGERAEFAGLGDAVLVQVAPHAHVRETGVTGVEDAVAVAVEVGEGVQGIAGKLAVLLERIDAEEFAPAVDRAIAVAVEDKKPVVARNPAGTGADAVGVVVEEDAGRAADADGLDAVAVEVERQGVAGFDEVARAQVKVVDIVNGVRNKLFCIFQ